MRKKRYSTMENTVLGIVWQQGPCTTYAVMRELKASNSTFYRNRAGTTYPIVERLIKSGDLGFVDAKIGSRKDRLIEVTEAGVSCLLEWLKPPIPEQEVGLTRDLLRLRVYFLGALSRNLREAFLKESKRALEAQLAACELEVERHKHLEDPFVVLADLGAVHETRARISWIDEITPVILELSE